VLSMCRSSSPDRSTCSRGCPRRRCSRPAVSVRRAPGVKVLAAAWGRGASAPAPPARTTSRASGRFAWLLGTWCGELDIGALSPGPVGVEPIRSMSSPGWYEPGRRQVNDVSRQTAAGDHPPDVAAARGSPWIPCAISISASVTERIRQPPPDGETARDVKFTPQPSRPSNRFEDQQAPMTTRRTNWCTRSPVSRSASRSTTRGRTTAPWNDAQVSNARPTASTSPAGPPVAVRRGSRRRSATGPCQRRLRRSTPPRRRCPGPHPYVLQETRIPIPARRPPSTTCAAR
jgi:hypothetical protein